ncbi:hypothetical protein J2Y02_001749 [Neobacillus drentensis]|nr:hypothetical protein [Neobacillus drentensis]
MADPRTVENRNSFKCSHFSASLAQVLSATFFGAITRTLLTANWLYFRSLTAVKVITVLPSPISSRSPNAGVVSTLLMQYR